MAEKSRSPHLFADVLARVHAVCGVLAAEDGWPAGIDLARVVVEPPRDAAHGDMATNAAMVLAKEARAKPRDLAEKIAAKLRNDDLIAKVDIAGPGFINLTLKPIAWNIAIPGRSSATISTTSFECPLLSPRTSPSRARRLPIPEPR